MTTTPISERTFNTGISTHSTGKITPRGEIHLDAGNVLGRHLFLSPEKATRLAHALLDASETVMRNQS